MKRHIEKELIRWKNQKNRKPLLLQGARQVGKTYVLQDFGRKQFNTFHYFDFEELKNDLSFVFETSSLNSKELINKLSFISGKSIDIKKDILILDEIQSIPRAITALKYFYQEMQELAVAAAGSNLGVAHSHEPFPVGKVEILQMYPMNFEEFLAGTGENMALSFLRNFQGGKTDDIYHRRLFDLLKTFFVTGGMPEAVNLYRAIPLQLSGTQNKKSKKFIFKDVISKGYRSYDDLADPVEWLVKAGLALKVSTNLHPSLPLMAGTKENSFKLFLFDTGLLGSMINLTPESILRYDYGSYKGYFAENFVLQELFSRGVDTVVSWSGRTSEIKFVLEIDGKIIPAEVKAGINTKAKSLMAFINKYNPEYSIKFTGNKFGFDRQNRIYNYPLYMISQFPDLSKTVSLV